MNEMATIDLPYVQRFKDRHGIVRHYYRRAGFKRIPLPGQVGSAEFMAAYAKAVEACRPAPKPAEARVQPRSITALVMTYYKSADFMALADSTKKAYRGVLDRFRAVHGDKGAATIQTHHLEAIFLGMAERPEAVRNLRKRLSQIFGLAVRLGWRADNPIRETKAPNRKRDAGYVPWSEDHITRFRETWKPGTRERLALELLLGTGQRRSDVVKMGPQHVQEGRISVVQQKSAHRLKIKLHPDLSAEIALHEVSGLAYLMTEQGAPFSVEGFGNFFRKACADAGLKGLSPHGLRKAQGRRLAEAGCTEKQIAAVLGHESLSEVARYTRDANRVHLADGAMDRLGGAETRTAAGKP